MRKSKGLRRRTRAKLKKSRESGITSFLAHFRPGDRVNIVLDPSSSSIPHPRWHGKTGTVIQKRGRAFVVKIFDAKKEKKLMIKPEHLRKV